MAIDLDLTACDREPIHLPGAVQPHGALVVADPATLTVLQAGGACEAFFGAAPEALVSTSLASLLGPAQGVIVADHSEGPDYAGAVPARDGGELDVTTHEADGRLILEFERAPSPRRSTREVTRAVEQGTRAIVATRRIGDACAAAAQLFRSVTGFDRVMIYRFLADESGEVVAEDRLEELPPFLGHRYPASDIPRQARALYLRNLIRVIPDIGYQPAPLVGLPSEAAALDMSDCLLRSVSPVHIQYLKNMGVAASASVSIVRSGALWGLVACHHTGVKGLSWEVRTICRLLAGALSQHIASLEDAELYQRRLRARAAEDALLAQNARGGAQRRALEDQVGDVIQLVPSTGVAIRRGGSIVTSGRCPGEAELKALFDWLQARPQSGAFATDALSKAYPAGEAIAALASGVLSVALSDSEPHQIAWLRAEQVEVINWAGDPHKPAEAGAEPAALTPRKSFALWQETVRGRSEPWSAVEIETAERLARAVAELRRAETLNRLNETLRTALDERDRRLAQTEDLLAEGNHRIQNNLQILAAMLASQLRETGDDQVRAQLEETLGRVNAVALVHARLHKSDHPESIDLEPYVRELMADLLASLGRDWAEKTRIHLAPVAVPAQTAMSIGLVLTELLLNAAKYAYGGESGPLEVQLEEQSAAIRLSVRDWGQGAIALAKPGGGFGSRMIASLVQRLGGALERTPAAPGLRVSLTLPRTGEGRPTRPPAQAA